MSIASIRLLHAPVRLSRRIGGPDNIALADVSILDVPYTGTAYVIWLVDHPATARPATELDQRNLDGQEDVLDHCAEANPGANAELLWWTRDVQDGDLEGVHSLNRTHN